MTASRADQIHAASAASASSNTPADIFQQMAERIRHNAGSQFGGAFVIVPPAEGGNPMETLILDNSANPAQFWMILQARSKMELARIEDEERHGLAVRQGRR